MRHLLIAFTAVALTACGGGGGDGPGFFPPPPNITGVYGSQSAPTIIDANGRFIGIGKYGGLATGIVEVAYSGTLATNGITWSASGANLGQTTYSIFFPEPVTSRTTTAIEGNFVESGELNRTILSPELSSIVTNPQRLPFISDPPYARASLTEVAGRYANTIINAGADFVVSPTGHISGFMSESCTFDGSVRVLDASHDVYNFTVVLTGSGCVGVPGRSYEMLGYLTSDTSPRLILVADFDGKPGYVAAFRQ